MGPTYLYRLGLEKPSSMGSRRIRQYSIYTERTCSPTNHSTRSRKSISPISAVYAWAKKPGPENSCTYDIPLIFSENEAEYGNPKADMQSSKEVGITSLHPKMRYLGAALTQLRELGLEKIDQTISACWSTNHRREEYRSPLFGLLREMALKVPTTMLLTMAVSKFSRKNCWPYSTYNSIDDRPTTFITTQLGLSLELVELHTMHRKKYVPAT